MVVSLMVAAGASALAVAAVAFGAVIREGFETVLFYKALYVTGGTGGAAPITAGFAAGAGPIGTGAASAS